MPYVNDRSPLGMNFHRETFFSRDWAFLDTFKQAAAFVSRAPNGSMDTRPIAVDAQGWPTSLQSSQWATTVFPTRDGGTYQVSWDGSGTVTLQGGPVTHLGPNILNIELLPNARGQLNIATLDPANPVRNIKIKKTSLASSPAVFHPTFLDRLGKFSTLRFMEWNRCDEVTATNWSERTPPDYAVQTGTLHGGVAYEHQIALCNVLHSNYWLNVPYTANDDYVTQLATLVRDSLDPTLKVYIEYSNECWNGVYPQRQYCINQGVAINLDPNPGIAGFKFQSQRSVQIFRIFEQVFGGTSRFVRVMGSFVGQVAQHQTLLSWQGASADVDALAVAGYFGVRFDQDPQGMAARVHSATVDQLMDYLYTWAVQDTLNLVSRSVQVARAYAKPLIAYEGGQHLTTPGSLYGDTDIQGKFDAANTHPRMADCYKKLLDGWKQLGGGLFTAYAYVYAPNIYGRWGALSSQDQDPSTAPKFQALSAWIDANLV